MIRTRYDQFAKAVLATLLQRVARVEVGREIPGHVEIADLWVWPDERLAAERDRLGLLGRMMELGPCLVEPFSGVPREHDIRGCILEQYALDRGQARDAERQGGDRPGFPSMWVIAAGSPDSIVELMELRPMTGWPEGFLCSRPFDPFRLVIVRKLPATPDTLFLRLLSRGVTFSAALAELRAQSGGARSADWAELEPVLVAFRHEFPQDLMEEEDMEALRHLESVYAELKRQHVQEGLEQGQHKGLLEGIEALCDILGIALTDRRREHLASLDIAGLEHVLATLRTTRRWPEP